MARKLSLKKGMKPGGLQNLMSLFLVFSLVFQSSYGMAQVRCSYVFNVDLSFLNHREFKEFVSYTINWELAQKNRQSGWLLFFWRKKLYDKIRLQCNSGNCDEKHIARVVQESLEEVIKFQEKTTTALRRWRGLILVVAISTATAVSSQFIKQHLPNELRFFAEFVTIVSSILLYRAGSPLWDYLAGEVQRLSYRSVLGKNLRKDHDELSHLIESYRVLQSKTTPMQQVELSRLTALLSNLDGLLGQVAILAGNPQRMDEIQARLAYFIIKARRLFPEIDLSKDPDVRRSWEAIFLQSAQKTLDLHELKLGLLKKIKEMDPDFSQHRVYYLKVLSAFFSKSDSR